MVGSDDLAWLMGSRWFVPLLALVSSEKGVRFAAAGVRLGVSRSMLVRAVDQLIGRGWLQRNPGHGHPLRPEFVLTDAGRPIGAWSERVMSERERLGLERGDLTRWSLPVARRLDGGWERFSTLEADLRPITPRALSLTLKQMLAVALVERRLEGTFPPLPLYGLTGRGRSLAEALA